ncbi:MULTISPECIES: hypothetical protein [unclassified Sphingomonas]|uniref:spike base protein, RCAP_Rcc01079 family n=1 Tax=unclassified Sphingomonas TaxID=196159 RepID=UPI00092CB090|nr:MULTISPECIES: hypothetical protein [unclassified Sphingomonas]MBN8848141.1 hypothetical protein [Sphingomonas sp.]OJV30638.1 MAG: hypothetical protein BGO24_07955 [Sphingomonas sp. 67-36]
MADPFPLDSSDMIIASSRAPYAVTPSDATPLPVVPKALYVGTAGNIVLRGVGGAADVTFKNVAAGQVLDVRASYVRATGTTAADIVALA